MEAKYEVQKNSKWPIKTTLLLSINIMHASNCSVDLNRLNNLRNIDLFK